LDITDDEVLYALYYLEKLGLNVVKEDVYSTTDKTYCSSSSSSSSWSSFVDSVIVIEPSLLLNRHCIWTVIVFEPSLLLNRHCHRSVIVIEPPLLLNRHCYW